MPIFGAEKNDKLLYECVMKYLLTIISVVLCLVSFLACESDTEKVYFSDAFLYHVQEGDTVRLGDSPESTLSLRLFYGCGVLEIYGAYITWVSSDTNIVKTRRSQSTIYGDSCYSICTLIPNGKAGAADITVTMLYGGVQRQMHFVATTDYSNEVPPPEGSFKERINGEEFTMVFVEADTLYLTGGKQGTEWVDTKDSVNVNRYYVHSQYLNDFYISQTEVTAELWKAVMGSEHRYQLFGGTQHPINNTSYGEAHEFLRKLNALTGRSYRLPWEAEWEFAARGGRKRKGYTYAGSNELDEVAWYWETSMKVGYGHRPHPVAQKMPNELQIYDMIGNVKEWCEDSLVKQSTHKVSFGGEYVLYWPVRRPRGWTCYTYNFELTRPWLENISYSNDGSRPAMEITKISYTSDSTARTKCIANIMADAEKEMNREPYRETCGIRLVLSASDKE